MQCVVNKDKYSYIPPVKILNRPYLGGGHYLFIEHLMI